MSQKTINYSVSKKCLSCGNTWILGTDNINKEFIWREFGWTAGFLIHQSACRLNKEATYGYKGQSKRFKDSDNS